MWEGHVARMLEMINRSTLYLEILKVRDHLEWSQRNKI
jgi:hypothetical protein